MPIASTSERWLSSCAESTGLIFKDITYEFLTSKLHLEISETSTKEILLTHLRAEISRDSSIFGDFKAFFILKYKEKKEILKRAYFRIRQSPATLNDFTKTAFLRLINSHAPVTSECKSGFETVSSEAPNITSAKFTHFSPTTIRLDTTTGEFSAGQNKATEIYFSYDHNKNLLQIESNDYKYIKSMVSMLEEITTYDFEPFGVYNRHATNPTKTILSICKKFFDDSWMNNMNSRGSATEQESEVSSKFISDLFNKNDEPIKKVGNINLSRCTLRYEDVTRDKIIKGLLRKHVAITGFSIYTFYKNHSFEIRIKSSDSFSTLFIQRLTHVTDCVLLRELHEKIEKLLFDSFK